MRVLLSALALTAALLLAGAASVLAADGAVPGDVPVTTDPIQPPTPPTSDTVGSAVETATQAAVAATQPAIEAAAPIVPAIADAAAPAAGSVGDTVEPIVDPVVDVVAPVAAPIVDVVAPVVEVVDPVVAPIVDVVDPVIQPVLDAVDPVIEPIVDVVDPLVDPGIDTVPPVTSPGLGDADPAGLTGVAAAAFDPSSILSAGLSWFDGGSSIGRASERPTSHGLVAVATGTPRAETGASNSGSPGDTPLQGAPLGLPAGSAGLGAALSPGVWIALLNAGLLAIVFYAFRRPRSSVPTLRGRSLLPALRPA